MLGERVNSWVRNGARHEHQEDLDHLLWSVNPRISFGILWGIWLECNSKILRDVKKSREEV